MTPEVRDAIYRILQAIYLQGLAYHDLSLAADARFVKAWLDAQPVMPEPDWSHAPEWAEWWAVDADGTALWYDVEPVVAFGDTLITQWRQQGDRKRGADWIDLPLGIDWRTTLRRRPK